MLRPSSANERGAAEGEGSGQWERGWAPTQRWQRWALPWPHTLTCFWVVVVVGELPPAIVPAAAAIFPANDTAADAGAGAWRTESCWEGEGVEAGEGVKGGDEGERVLSTRPETPV